MPPLLPMKNKKDKHCRVGVIFQVRLIDLKHIYLYFALPAYDLLPNVHMIHQHTGEFTDLLPNVHMIHWRVYSPLLKQTCEGSGPTFFSMAARSILSIVCSLEVGMELEQRDSRFQFYMLDDCQVFDLTLFFTLIIGVVSYTFSHTFPGIQKNPVCNQYLMHILQPVTDTCLLNFSFILLWIIYLTL